MKQWIEICHTQKKNGMNNYMNENGKDKVIKL